MLIRLASCGNKSLVPRIALIQWLVFALQAAVASRNRSLTTNLLWLDIFVPFSWKRSMQRTPRIFVVYSISGEVVLTSQAAFMSAPPMRPHAGTSQSNRDRRKPQGRDQVFDTTFLHPSCTDSLGVPDPFVGCRRPRSRLTSDAPSASILSAAKRTPDGA